MNKTVITISREYGSGGRYVGEILARNLGVKFFDKSLIKLIADASGLSKHCSNPTRPKGASPKKPRRGDIF